MELKEILNQNSQKASSKLNYITGPSGHSNEAFPAPFNLLYAILKIANRKSHLGARYETISLSLMKTSNVDYHVRTHHLLSKNTHQTKI
jgi:hypothetical protein